MSNFFVEHTGRSKTICLQTIVSNMSHNLLYLPISSPVDPPRGLSVFGQST